MPKLGGGLEGFQIDLFTEVAKRMKREITIDVGQLLDLIPGMQCRPLRLHRRADHGDQGARGRTCCSPRAISGPRYQFGIKKGTPPIKGWEDLKGKAVAVNKGTPYETLSQADGREVRLHGAGLRHPAGRDAGRAVGPRLRDPRRQHGRSSTRAKEPAVRRRPRAHGHARPLGGARSARTSAPLRDQMQDALDCMKKDGTIAKLSEKWFGAKPRGRRPRAW